MDNAVPPLECDLVMKGGITSGVIYPLAVCELARVYRLRSIGGSSAGAIGAGAAAAAELGRASGGFDRLAQLPTLLTEAVPGRGSRMFTLFQPSPPTRGLFNALTSGLGKSGGSRLAATGKALLTSYAVAALLGALPGVLLAILGFIIGGAAAYLNLVVCFGILVGGVAIGVTVAMVRELGRMGAGHFGLCSGMDVKGYGGPAMTPWLHTQFQTIADRVDGPPLTFRDLLAQQIDLQVMTTNLSRQEPMRMPWDGGGYYFDPEEFRALFPEDVVAHLVKCAEANHPADTSTAEDWLTVLDQAQALPLLPFPEANDIPIIVAVRMSLSFPGLIAALPLHCVDFSRDVNKAHGREARAWRDAHPGSPPSDAVHQVPGAEFQANWFSDGGICANLPLHFFDSAIPNRPTFAIDLESFPPDRAKAPAEYDNSYLPTTNSGGMLRRQSVLKTSGVGAMAQFGSSILNTARGWVDEAQLSMPGYRDRIVTIFHDDREGGMNLNMAPVTVTALSERGRGGAQRLVSRFAGSHPGVVAAPGWDNQRWIRFRVATASLDAWLKSFADHYDAPHPGTTPYATWVGTDTERADWEPPPLPSYTMTLGRRRAMRTRIAGLLAAAREWEEAPPDAFTKDAPSPHPSLKVVPAETSSP